MTQTFNKSSSKLCKIHNSNFFQYILKYFDFPLSIVINLDTHFISEIQLFEHWVTKRIIFLTSLNFVLFVVLRPSQQLWSCRDGSPNHTFFLGKLDQAFNQYFVHILFL